ncbi:MAG: hypothetical protein U9R52_02985 [Candidatus Omnitrophota bacterium]|nr:hypothetical protein [Candidatus Omnitrophota bacterium]
MIQNTPAYQPIPKNEGLYIPPNPKYFDYENRYTSPHKNQLYPVDLTPTPISGNSGIEDFLEQRQDVINARIQMLYSEMGVRSYINGQLLYRINYDQCTCQNLIMARGEEFLDRQRMDLENKILDLEQEKRREETALFRDLSFLNKEMRFARIEAMEEQQKQALCLNQEAMI